MFVKLAHKDTEYLDQIGLSKLAQYGHTARHAKLKNYFFSQK